MLQCYSTTAVLLTAILVIAQKLDLNFRGLKIFAHGFQSAKTAKVSSHENLSAYSSNHCPYMDNLSSCSSKAASPVRTSCWSASF